MRVVTRDAMRCHVVFDLIPGERAPSGINATKTNTTISMANPPGDRHMKTMATCASPQRSNEPRARDTLRYGFYSVPGTFSMLVG